MVVSAGLVLSQPAAGQNDVPEVVRRLLEEGSRHLRQERVDEAIEVLNEARRLGPDTVQVYLDLGAAWVQKGDLEKSKEAFEAGLKVDGTHRDLLYNAAIVCLRTGAGDAALGHVSEALKAHGDSADLLLVKAGSLARLERHEEALAALRLAEREQPKSARIQFSLGNQLHRLGRLDDAVVAFEKAARLDPKQTRALYNLGAVWVELGRYDDAREAYEKALEPFNKALAKGHAIDKIHAVAYSNLGAAYTQSQDWAKAVEAYSVATRVDPELADAHLNLGFAFFQLEKWKKALQAYEKAAQLNPELSLAYVQLGEIHHRQGRCDQAVAWFQKGLPKLQATERLRVMEGMARCYTDLGQIENAEQVFRQVLEEAPDDPKVLKEFGTVLRRRGRMEEARRALARSLELRSDDLPTLLEALAVEEHLQDRSAEARLLQAIADRHGDEGHLWPVRKNLALLRLAESRWADAHKQLAALAKSPGLPAAEKPWVATLVGLTSWLTGSPPRNALDGAPDPLGRAPGPAAVARAEAGDLTAALALLDELPPSTQLDGLRGLLLWSGGRTAEASELLRRAEAAGLDTPALGIALASVELRDGSTASVQRAMGRLEASVGWCAEGSATDRPTGELIEGVLVVRPAPGIELCAFAEQALQRARLADGMARLSSSPGRAVARAREVLADPSSGSDQRALASFIEGTALLAQGAHRGAAAALHRGLGLAPAAPWKYSAENNLGLAWARLGETVKAKQQFQSAKTGSVAAILNLAILLHEQEQNPEAALGLYEEYIRAGGPRRQEVKAWVDRLRELYP